MSEIKSYWPLISVAAVGLIAWGATTTTVASDNARLDKVAEKVEKLDDRAGEQQVIISTQTIKLQTLDTRTQEIKGDVDTIEKDVKDILFEIRAMRHAQERE